MAASPLLASHHRPKSRRYSAYQKSLVKEIGATCEIE